MGVLESLDKWSIERISRLNSMREHTQEMGSVTPILSLEIAALEVFSGAVLATRVLTRNGGTEQ